MVKKIVTWRNQFHKNLATFFLMSSVFFNPIGFDFLFKMILDWTDSYWITDAIFYSAAGFCFLLYIYFRKSSKR